MRVQNETAHHRLWNSAPWVASLGIVVYWVVLGNRFSLWIDEAFSVRMSQRPLDGLVRQVLVDEGNMGPYYLVLWLWEKVLPGDQLARAPAAIGTLLTIWGVWTIARRRADVVIAAGAVVVFTANPFVLSWSIQARGYTLVMAAAAWALVAADSLVRNHSRSSALVLGVLTGLSTATLLSSAFVYVGVFILVIVVTRSIETLKLLVVAGVAALAVFAPFSYAFLRNRNQVRWIDPITGRQFIEETVQFLGGVPTALTYWLCAVAVVGLAVRNRRVRLYLIPMCITVSSFVALVLFSIFVQPLYVSRYLAASTPFLVLGVIGLCEAFHQRTRERAVAVVALSCIAVTAVWSTNALPPDEDYRWAVSVIDAEYRPGDGVAAHPFWVISTLDANWDSPPLDIYHVRGVNESGALVLRQDSPGRGFPRRLWLVSRGPVNFDSNDDMQFSRLMDLYPIILERYERGFVSVHLLDFSE